MLINAYQSDFNTCQDNKKSSFEQALRMQNMLLGRKTVSRSACSDNLPEINDISTVFTPGFCLLYLEKEIPIINSNEKLIMRVHQSLTQERNGILNASPAKSVIDIHIRDVKKANSAFSSLASLRAQRTTVIGFISQLPDVYDAYLRAESALYLLKEVKASLSQRALVL
jgi:hypothetical protein